MKQMFGFVLATLLVSVGAYAHNDNDHIKGTVTQITGNAITVQLADKTTKTVTVAERTAFEKSGKKAVLQDLKVGDRVVIEVKKGMLRAEEVRFGAPAATPKAPAEHVHHD